MFEYVLGIGNLTEEQCLQVIEDVSKRASNMRKTLSFINDEYNHLEMIKFQVKNRLIQIKEKDIN